MGAEYMGAMGGASFDHDVTRVVAGDAESLRARLADALERMGYRVLNENPIQARHLARAAWREALSQDILDYHRSLHIGLKSAGANSTRVTFAYTVKGVLSGFITKGRPPRTRGRVDRRVGPVASRSIILPGLRRGRCWAARVFAVNAALQWRQPIRRNSTCCASPPTPTRVSKTS